MRTADDYGNWLIFGTPLPPQDEIVIEKPNMQKGMSDEEYWEIAGQPDDLRINDLPADSTGADATF